MKSFSFKITNIWHHHLHSRSSDIFLLIVLGSERTLTHILSIYLAALERFVDDIDFLFSCLVFDMMQVEDEDWRRFTL